MFTANTDFGARDRARLLRSRPTEGNTFNETRSMDKKRRAACQYAADVRARRNGG